MSLFLLLAALFLAVLFAVDLCRLRKQPAACKRSFIAFLLLALLWSAMTLTGTDSSM